MKAGRELDALIAERVMGWEWWHKGNYSQLIKGGETWPENPYFSLSKGKAQSGSADDSGMPHYSTDIAAAWLIVEHMRANVPSCRALRMESVPLGYMAAFYSRTNRLDRIGAFVGAETAPLTICLAALKALNIEVPNENGRIVNG